MTPKKKDAKQDISETAEFPETLKVDKKIPNSSRKSRTLEATSRTIRVSTALKSKKTRSDAAHVLGNNTNVLQLNMTKQLPGRRERTPLLTKRRSIGDTSATNTVQQFFSASHIGMRSRAKSIGL